MSDLKMKVRDQEYEVTVETTHDGRGAWFRLDVGGGRTLTSQTWEGLYKNAMTATKRPSIQVAVPVMEYMARLGRFREGTATGLHQGTGKVLVTWKWLTGRESTEQMDGYGTYFRPMTEDEKAEYDRLFKAALAAKNAQAQFENEHTFSLRSEVSEAIEAELASQVEAEL
jgi:hypothetical protein